MKLENVQSTATKVMNFESDYRTRLPKNILLRVSLFFQFKNVLLLNKVFNGELGSELQTRFHIVDKKSRP